MKGVGNKRWNTWNIIFLRYLTDGLGMIYLRVILPEVIHQNIDFSSHNIDFPFSDHHMFFGNFREIFGIFFQKISGKILFSHLYTLFTPHITHPHPTPNIPNRELNQNFKFTFLKILFLVYFARSFPKPFMYPGYVWGKG